jgi:hypothetical protein
MYRGLYSFRLDTLKDINCPEAPWFVVLSGGFPFTLDKKKSPLTLNAGGFFILAGRIMHLVIITYTILYVLL